MAERRTTNSFPELSNKFLINPSTRHLFECEFNSEDSSKLHLFEWFFNESIDNQEFGKSRSLQGKLFYHFQKCR